MLNKVWKDDNMEEGGLIVLRVDGGRKDEHEMKRGGERSRGKRVQGQGIKGGEGLYGF